MEAQSKSLSSQIAYLSYGFAVTLIVILGSFGWWAASRIDDRAMARQTRSVLTELNELAARIPIEQDSSAVWDDSVVNLRSNNEAWIAENLAEWMSIHFAHDRVYILNPQDRVQRAVASGVQIDDSVYGPDMARLLPLIDDLRQEMAVASSGEADSTPFVTGLGKLDYVSLYSEQAAIVSIRPIIPSSAAVEQAAGSEYLIISLRFLAGPLLNEIRASTELHDLAFENEAVTGDDRIRRPVFDASGRIIGFFSWVPEEPAYELIKETAPVIAFGVLAAALAVAMLLRRLKRTSTILEATKAKASFLAFHDPLTGIPNRALFEDRLDQALANMRRTGSLIALHYIDLDRFKHINDTLGHPAGDELIRTAAKRLVELVDEVDTVARLGGDEFAIIQFQPRDVSAAEALSQTVVEALSLPVPVAGVEALVGASVGVIVTADPSVDAADLMRQADIALYQAKDNGRGRYQLFAGEMDDAVRERRQLEIELRAALATGEGLALVYQPIFASKDVSLSGVEALVRWDHPTRGRMPPDLFITLAEERGLIDQLGLWVLRSACLFVAQTDLPWVAVNVSPMQFRSERFAQTVLSVLHETGMSPQRLQIEITEGLLLQNSPAIQAILNELRANGIRIALDDFGTGYSSISYLRNHGIDKLKIDQSFTALLGEDPQIESIIKSIVDLGRAMNMIVTAEGVETSAQKALLVEIGCDELQGYLMSRPVPGEQLSHVGKAQARR